LHLFFKDFSKKNNKFISFIFYCPEHIRAFCENKFLSGIRGAFCEAED